MYYFEKCPKCGGKIMSVVLTSNPPINKKICEQCGTAWVKKTDFEQVVFNPDAEGYTEITSSTTIKEL